MCWATRPIDVNTSWWPHRAVGPLTLVCVCATQGVYVHTYILCGRISHVLRWVCIDHICSGANIHTCEGAYNQIAYKIKLLLMARDQTHGVTNVLGRSRILQTMTCTNTWGSWHGFEHVYGLHPEISSALPSRDNNTN